MLFRSKCHQYQAPIVRSNWRIRQLTLASQRSTEFRPATAEHIQPARFRTIQVYPKDLRALPLHPKPALSWHSGSGEEPMLDLRQRQFITLLGSTSAAWPLSARAQAKQMRRIGLLQGLAESDGSSLFHPGARHEKSPSRLC